MMILGESIECMETLEGGGHIGPDPLAVEIDPPSGDTERSEPERNRRMRATYHDDEGSDEVVSRSARASESSERFQPLK